MPVIGIRGVMTIDIISFLFAITALFLVHIPNPEFTGDQSIKSRHYREDLWFGLKYLWKHKGLFWLMLI